MAFAADTASTAVKAQQEPHKPCSLTDPDCFVQSKLIFFKESSTLDV